MAVFRGRGWRRIGIVLSVIWFVGFSFYLWSSEVSRIGDFYSWQLKNCYAGESIRNEALQYAKDEKEREAQRSENDVKTKVCQAEASSFHQHQWQQLKNSVWILLAIDVATILVGWLLVWVVVAVVRWINRGFASV